MKMILGITAFLLILLVGFLLYQNFVKYNLFLFGPSATAEIKQHKFQLALADTDKKREIGLSDKTSISKDSGMLFIFNNPGYYPFWMRNMKFSIDMLFIKDNKIVTIYKNLKPPKSPSESLPTYISNEPADKVLEISAGLSDQYDIKNGDTIKLENIK